MSKKVYRIKVDANNTQAAINEIQQRIREDVKKDFLSRINEDGSVPRGLLSSLAREYGYTQAGITKLLRSLGISMEHRVIQPNNQQS